MNVTSFLTKFAPACVAAMLKNGGFASVRLAQIALESGWGDASPKDIDSGKESYNLTGVKGDGPAGCVWAWSPEEENGKWVPRRSKFRAYESYEQHICERDRIFDWDNYDAYRAATTPEAAIHALAHAPMPYATDTQYEAKLLDILRRNDLKRFDAYVFVDVPGDHSFAGELADMKRLGFVRGDDNGRLAMSNESVRILVVCKRMYDAAIRKDA